MNRIIEILDAEDIKFFVDTLVARREAEMERKDKAAHELANATRSIKLIEYKLEKLRQSLPQHAASEGKQVELLPETTSKGRVKTGLTEKLVTDFLKARNGTGATVKQMSESLGLRYPTVHRFVNILKDRGQAARDDDSLQWHWVSE